MFKIINYFTFNMIIEKKKTNKQIYDNGNNNNSVHSAKKKKIENKCDWRVSVVYKSIGRSSLIRWNVFTHSRDAERMASSSIFQFQWIVYLIFFSHSRARISLFLCFFSSIFFSPTMYFFRDAHGVECFYFHFIYLMALHSGRLVSLVCGKKKESICNNKMTIDLMENDDSNAETEYKSNAKSNTITAPAKQQSNKTFDGKLIDFCTIQWLWKLLQRIINCLELDGQKQSRWYGTFSKWIVLNNRI